MRKSSITRGSGIVFYVSLGPRSEMKNCCVIIVSFLRSLRAQVKGRSRQSNCDLVRYLNRSIKIDFSGDRKDLGGSQFHM